MPRSARLAHVVESPASTGRRLGRSASAVGPTYEITSTFAQLVIEADSPILMHGSLTDFEANSELILAPLRVAAVAYRAG
jgi:hypothetical protein